MNLSDAFENQRVQYIDKLPECISPKGCGTILSITACALLVLWDDGEVFLVHADDVEEIKNV